MDEQDRRLTGQLLHQWQQAAGISLPPLSIFKRAAIMGLWPNCVLVSVERTPQLAYKCEHMGSTITRAYGKDLTGSYLPMSDTQFPGIVAFNKLGDMAADPRPIEDDGEFTSPTGKSIKYRACFLPYGDDPKVLSHILIGLSFREF